MTSPFRLRGIPHLQDKSDMYHTLQSRFEDASITVQSLAASPGQSGEKTATGSMHISEDYLNSLNMRDFETPQMNIRCHCHKCSRNIAEGQKPVHDDDLVLDFDLADLTILHSPIAENWEFDIIAVRSVDRDALRSFKAPDSSDFMWLHDRLPKDIPGSRVFVWGYDMQRFEELSERALEDLGISFSEILHWVWSNGVAGHMSEDIGRPTILLGHSIGSVVIQEAILTMLAKSNVYGKVLRAISGIIFFDVLTYGTTTPSLIQPTDTKPNDHSQWTSEGPPFVQRSDEFFEGIDWDLDIVAFCSMQVAFTVEIHQEECKISKPLYMLAGKGSATIGELLYRGRGQFHTEGINRARHNLARVKGPQDELYQFQILPWLKRFQGKSTPFPDHTPGTIFRLRGIPQRFSKPDLMKFVRVVLGLRSDIEVHVQSLACGPDDLDGNYATLRFQPIPQQLSKASSIRRRGDAWRLERTFEGMGLVTLDLDTHFHGMTPLHIDDNDSCKFDIIALSGLNGHAFGSFKERRGPWMWLRDALPYQIRGIRVFIYGYNTKLVGSSSFQNLKNLGQVLYLTIRNMREAEAKSREPAPLILIGHSLGGLLIKQISARTIERDRINDTILRSILGIQFFGTPHSGMNIGSLVQMVQERPNMKLLQSLEIDSPSLKELYDQSHAVLESLNPKPDLVAFFETNLSASARMVVSKDKEGNIQETWRMDGDESLAVEERSATLNIQKQYPINRGHSDMVKFESRYDIYYKIVRDHIRSLLEQPRGRPDVEIGFQDGQNPPLERVANQRSESSVQRNSDQKNMKADSHKDETEH